VGGDLKFETRLLTPTSTKVFCQDSEVFYVNRGIVLAGGGLKGETPNISVIKRDFCGINGVTVKTFPD